MDQSSYIAFLVQGFERGLTQILSESGHGQITLDIKRINPTKFETVLCVSSSVRQVLRNEDIQHWLKP